MGTWGRLFWPKKIFQLWLPDNSDSWLPDYGESKWFFLKINQNILISFKIHLPLVTILATLTRNISLIDPGAVMIWIELSKVTPNKYKHLGMLISKL